MEIGGGEFVMGVSKKTENPDDFSMALKMVVYGMDSLETAQSVFEKLSETLLALDPQLQIAENEGEDQVLN